MHPDFRHVKMKNMCILESSQYDKYSNECSVLTETNKEEYMVTKGFPKKVIYALKTAKCKLWFPSSKTSPVYLGTLIFGFVAYVIFTAGAIFFFLIKI